MYIGPWQEFQLALILHREQNATSRHTTLARAGRMMLEKDPGGDKYPHIRSERSERSYYSAPVVTVPKGKKPLKHARTNRVCVRIAKMRELYGLEPNTVGTQPDVQGQSFRSEPLREPVSPRGATPPSPLLLTPKMYISECADVNAESRPSLPVLPSYPRSPSARRPKSPLSFTQVVPHCNASPLRASLLRSSKCDTLSPRSPRRHSLLTASPVQSSVPTSPLRGSREDLVAWANALRLEDLGV